jgi:hypothetical protein
MLKKKAFNFILIIFSIIFFILLFEIFIRSFFAIIKTDTRYFFYGFNKNINIKVNSLSNLEFYINDSSQIKLKDDKISFINQEKEIMVFGGSTSMAYCPESTSWPDYLGKELNRNVINFARAGKNSDYSVEVLLSQLNKKTPESIIWAHKANEYTVAYFGLDRNKGKLSFPNINFTSNFKKNLYYFKSASLSLKKILFFYFLLDEIILRIQLKNGKLVHYQDIISDDNLIVSSYNYKINTLDAIRYSFDNGVTNFYIISLFNEYDLIKNSQNLTLRSETDKRFEFFFKERINEILSEYKNKNVYFIDTVNLINDSSNLKEYSEKKLFCDPTHQNNNGHLLTSQLVNKFIKLKYY